MSGLFGMFLLPIIIIVFVLAILFSSCSVNYVTVEEYSDTYDENELQDFADEQYAAEFGKSTAYEDNLLIVVLTDDDYYEYSYIAWAGDHIVTSINNLLGNEQTELGRAMSASINETSYKYSLDSNLAQVMELMTQEVAELGVESSFTCEENHNQVSSHLTNKSDIPMTEETVNNALEKFTEQTGISTVIVVEDADEVFGTQTIGNNGTSIWKVLTVLVVVGVVVYLIVRGVLKRKEN